MKILRLSLHNLASLTGTHHIDFESSPLAHAGLIAITGKTGAGKSTLLDAMCLALYNEIPRVKGATGSLKDAGGQDVSIKDSRIFCAVAACMVLPNWNLLHSTANAIWHAGKLNGHARKSMAI